VNGDTEILYERDEGIYVTTLTGFYSKLYPKTISFGNLIVSPKGRYVVIVDVRQSMTIIDLTTSTLVKTIKTDQNEFQPRSMGDGFYISIQFPKVFFNQDESRMYFIMERTYSDDGC
jgi:hypothetical protein